MMVTGFLLRQVLETNSNLVKKLIILALEMYVKAEFEREFILNFFDELDKDILDENLIFWKGKYELTKELLSKGISPNDIINNYGIQELFIYLAQ